MTNDKEPLLGTRCMDCKHHGYFMDCKGEETAKLFAQVSGKMYCWKNSKLLNLDETACKDFQKIQPKPEPRDFDYITDSLESARDSALEVHEEIGLLGDTISDLIMIDLEIGGLEEKLTSLYQRQKKLRDVIGQELWAELEKRAKTRLAFKD